MARPYVRCFLLGALYLAGLPAQTCQVRAAGEPKKVLLRFKGSRAVDSFTVERQERIIETSWEGEQHRNDIVSRQAFKRRAVGRGNDRVAIKLKMVSSSLTLNGKEVPPPPNPAPFITEMTVLGEEVPTEKPPARSGLPRSRVHFVLPVEAVAPNDEWERTVPADEAFPAPLTVHYRLVSIGPFRGSRCALVQLRASSQNYFSDRKCRSRVSARGRFYFDIAAGRIKASQTVSSFILTYVSRLPDRPMQSLNMTKTKVLPTPPTQ